jgi:hypothetical protein
MRSHSSSSARAAAIALAALSGAALPACAPDPITALNVQGCVRKNCTDAEAVAYQTCEASCRARYGR